MSNIKNKTHWGEQTKAIHAGEPPDPVTKASSPNLVMSTTFVVGADTGFSVEGLEENDTWIYTRWGNPTVHQLEEKLAALEDAETAVAFASGMGAIVATLFHILKAGDHAIISDVAYAALSEITNEMIPKLDIEITKVDTSDLNAIKNAVKHNTKLIYTETPCNPLLRLTDIAAVANIAHNAGAKLAVDSTFATPAATKPLQLGADFVIHSLTKYLGGHGDALGGVVLGSKTELIPLRKKTSIRLGGVLSPFNAWLILRGLATFPIRKRIKGFPFKVAIRATFHCIRFKRWQIFVISIKSYRKFSRRIVIAKQYIGNCTTSILTAIPGIENSRKIRCFPRNSNGTSGHHHEYSRNVSLCQCLHQMSLDVRQNNGSSISSTKTFHLNGHFFTFQFGTNPTNHYNHINTFQTID
ncbi:L-methionine gamma-lyase [termite gut metagenome]|uniref:L-methionine gamma-lyase n=1 Tax=termite gut metagenome TaxID=433724 RepID=A0A5J4R1Q6_9ZZZZ